MKRKSIFLLTAVLLFTMLFSSCTDNNNKSSSQDVWNTVEEAYVYAFPLVLTDATKTVSVNAETATNKRAPINQLIHASELLDANSKVVVTPNVDTVYTQAWLDIGEEPMIYVVPEADRFFNVQVLDAWTNTVSVLDKPGAYAIALPNQKFDVPADVTRIDVPTATVWTIARIVLSGEDDLPNVNAIQKRMKLMPISAYTSGGEYTAPVGTYLKDNDFVPVEKVLSMSPKEFFDTANKLMTANPPSAADEELLEKFAAINVGAGLEFDPTVLTGDVADRWKQMLTGLRSVLAEDGMNYAVKLGQWQYFGSPIGDFGTEYKYRALIALCGLGANTVDVAIYPKTEVDSSGETLNGEKTYTIHFESLPPTLDNGFWSVTAYGCDDFLIDNPLNRYCINDRSEFVLGDDGSLDIVLSKEQPENTSNWLPVADGEFHLFMRIYTPDMKALESWNPPVIIANN